MVWSLIETEYSCSKYTIKGSIDMDSESRVSIVDISVDTFVTVILIKPYW